VSLLHRLPFFLQLEQGRWVSHLVRCARHSSQAIVTWLRLYRARGVDSREAESGWAVFGLKLGREVDIAGVRGNGQTMNWTSSIAGHLQRLVVAHLGAHAYIVEASCRSSDGQGDKSENVQRFPLELVERCLEFGSRRIDT
jgi:hypothetical protein